MSSMPLELASKKRGENTNFDHNHLATKVGSETIKKKQNEKGGKP